ncbi:MAG TPA: asparagine synthase (glutamine-hydrolyzing) [Gemmatimonadales bacterium]|nr:asparagine synthase (glutamine-hydrolyzing) [Gemmatimonadales bacterium]
MCGIAGAVTFRPGARPDHERLCRMAGLMAHRGPDGEGFWADPQGRAAFAHRRLSIIDIAGGRQPMCSDDGQIALVFNGEIYNYRELRRVLSDQGVQFHTVSDTEVLLRLYERFGSDVVHHLRGMFAFAVWDGTRGELVLARDRVGKKPLFYSLDDDSCYFASTLGALRDTDAGARRVSLAALDAFLTLGYVPAPQSIWDGISKLPAGTMLRVSSQGARSLRYWALEQAVQPFMGRFTQAVDRLEALLTTAVALRLRSDVPLGLFLSGGVDSSLVTAIASRQCPGETSTFSLGFAETAFDESGYAERIAQHLGTRHRTITGHPDMVDILPALVRHAAEPFGDASALAVWMLAEETRKHVTVVLTGDGGDEGFGGYDWYRTALALKRWRGLAPNAALRLGTAVRSRRPWAQRIQRGLRALALDEPERFAALRTCVADEEVQTLYAGDLLRERRDNGNAVRAWLAQLYRSGNGPALRRMRLVDVHSYLADCLMPKVDIATMAHGLEARSPLLDQEVLEFALGLPDEWLLDGDGGKPLLKALLARFVPAELYQRPKHGFDVPLPVWFAYGPTSAWADQLADSESLRDCGWLNPVGIRDMAREHREGVRDHSQRLYNLVVLREWLNQH